MFIPMKEWKKFQEIRKGSCVSSILYVFYSFVILTRVSHQGWTASIMEACSFIHMNAICFVDWCIRDTISIHHHSHRVSILSLSNALQDDQGWLRMRKSCWICLAISSQLDWYVDILLFCNETYSCLTHSSKLCLKNCHLRNNWRSSPIVMSLLGL